jgi:Rrf2 family protein
MPNVLRISEAASLALHAMVLLAKSAGRPLSNLDAAAAMGGSANTLSKVLQRLSKAGLAESARGPHGGFRLARKADEIRLLDIYEAVEGPLGEPQCLLAQAVCDGRDCVLGGLVGDVHKKMGKYLQGTTLAALAKKIKIQSVAC